jgi:N utilization substance protein B
MQAIYAMHQSQNDDLDKQEKFLKYSQDAVQDLYLVMFSFFIELSNTEKTFLEVSSKKHLATKLEKEPNFKFVDNAVFTILKNCNALSIAIADRKINLWHLQSDYVQLILTEIKSSTIYEDYMSSKNHNFKDEVQFATDIFTEIIAPNEKIYDLLQDNIMTWTDDVPLVNTQILKDLGNLKPILTDNFKPAKLYKDVEDQEFSVNLFRKTVLNETEFLKTYEDKTPNWDIDRIPKLDIIIMNMAICEFLKFPSIPTKVTINEYLELAKDYSTPKSNIFINGILDVLVKEMTASNKIKKIGRGLM